MTTDHLTAEQRAASTFFLDGQGWGFGGSVDVERIEPWNVPGRYGWIGGFGTAAYVDPVGSRRHGAADHRRPGEPGAARRHAGFLGPHRPGLGT